MAVLSLLQSSEGGADVGEDARRRRRRRFAGRGRRPTGSRRGRGRTPPRRRPLRRAAPWASSAPIIPDSTSPDPAVAAHDCPAGLRYTGPPGSAIDGDVALEQHGGAELVGQRARGPDPVVAGRRSRPAGRTHPHAASAPSARTAIDDERRDERPGWSARRRRRSPAGRCPARTTARRRRRRRCRSRVRPPRPAPARPTRRWATR